ncbi:hypothetical protein K7432_010103 [Basidiobolus ranarum]|uniref:AAA+ ATPase domain-containing protein n=1 Tax=Basidiobolus ranarum TaxID=34480 RepID=A0ABR2VVZ7_9FUNG
MRTARILERFGTFIQDCDLVEVPNNVLLVKPLLDSLKSCFSAVQLQKEMTWILQPQAMFVSYITDETNGMQSTINGETNGILSTITERESYAISMESDSLIQIYTWPNNHVYILDLLSLTKYRNEILSMLGQLLKNESPKYFYDCGPVFSLLEELLEISYQEFNGCIDVQVENNTMSVLIRKLGIKHYLKETVMSITAQSSQVWSHRPMHRDLVIYAALDAYCIHQISDAIKSHNALMSAADTIKKYEIYKLGVFVAPINLEIECDTDVIGRAIGYDLIKEIELSDTDVFLDIGRKTRLNRHSSSRIVSGYDISAEMLHSILENYPNTVGNRVILGPTLHRLSRVMYEDKPVGLTWRLGRKIKGLAPIFLEKVDASMNILICGPPNVGKTSFLRALCEDISMNKSLCLIDTSGEVCGSSGILGDSRIFKPSSPEKQYDLMMDIVKNHSPSHIVIDEIHTKEEMKLCSTISKRGVKVIASVHGLFHDLIYNQELNASIGGIHKTILSDARADLIATGRKTRIERQERSLFDVAIQLTHSSGRFEYCFITDISNAVDRILNDQTVKTVYRYLTEDGVYEKQSSIDPSTP